jgi:hypothetical protein
MAKTEPGITDIKRLFAHSGNRCAFPKCTMPVFLDGILVGKVCHIKGAKLGSARYDEHQSDEERHAYENLIVMCGVHHDVIDSDDVSYTVQRLHQIKEQHGRGATPLSDAQASQITQIYIQTVNVQKDIDPSRSTRELQAVERIWNMMVNLRNEFGDVIFIDTVLVPAELDAFFGERDSHPLFDTIAHYRDQMCIMHKVNKAGTEGAPRERPFIDQRLYALYSALYGLLARSAMLLCLSFKRRKYYSWRDDDLTVMHIRSVLPSATIDALKARDAFCLQTVAAEMERLFNEIARR